MQENRDFPYQNIGIILGANKDTLGPTKPRFFVAKVTPVIHLTFPLTCTVYKCAEAAEDQDTNAATGTSYRTSVKWHNVPIQFFIAPGIRAQK